MFEKIKGQKRAKKIILNSLKHKQTAQSYLFYGPAGVGKFTTALYLAMALNCTDDSDMEPCGVCNSCKKITNFNHPDFTYIFPTPNMNITADGQIKKESHRKEFAEYLKQKRIQPWQKFYFSSNTMIRIDIIRMLQNRINLSLHEGKKKIAIIENAEEMNFEAANAFLKTLEEPPEDTILILTTNKMNSLLPTIISRCQRIQFMPLTTDVIELELEDKDYITQLEAKTIAKISNGSMEKALQLADSKEFTARDEAINLVKLAMHKKDLKFLDFLNVYSSSAKRNEMLDIISFLVVIISDLAYLVNNPERIVNIDNLDLLEEIYHKNNCVEDEIPEFVNFLEEMKYRIHGHVNPQLIFSNIFFKLSEFILGEKVS